MHSSIAQAAQAPESDSYTRGMWQVVSEKEVRCYVASENEGSPESWDHQRVSQKRETQASSSGRNKSR